MRNNKLWLLVALVLAVGLIVFATVNRNQTMQRAQVPGNVISPFNGAMFDPVGPAPDIELTDHRGRPFHLREQTGNVVVLFFGFTSCPDVCPTTLANFRQVKQHLGDDADRVRFVMVSVDPERDTQERMAQYVEAFDPDFIGLTGTLEEVKVAWDAYNVYPEKIELPNSALGYTVTHPASSYIIDQYGDLRLLHFYGLPADAVAEDLQTLLALGPAADRVEAEPAASRAEEKSPGVRVERAWARPAIAGGNGAVYFTLTNDSEAPVTLIGAETDVAKTVEIHQTVLLTEEEAAALQHEHDHDHHDHHSDHGHDHHNDHDHHAHHGHDHEDDEAGVFVMLHVDHLEVASKDQVVFDPAGHHIMLIDLTKNLAWDDTFPLTLHFQEIPPVTVLVSIGNAPDA